MCKYLAVTYQSLIRVLHHPLIPQLRNLNNSIPCVYNLLFLMYKYLAVTSPLFARSLHHPMYPNYNYGTCLIVYLTCISTLFLLYKQLAVTSLLTTRVLQPSLLPHLRNLNNCIPSVNNIFFPNVQILRGNLSITYSFTSSPAYTATQVPE